MKKALLLSAVLIFTGLNSMTLKEYPRPFLPDPTRFEKSIAAFSAIDEKSNPPENAIVATGSSTIERWHDRIKNDLEGLTIIPRGIGGSEMSDIIYYADDLILKYHPRAVLLYEGDNDLAGGKSPERVLSDLKFLVDYCRSKQPDLRFYVLSVKPSIDRWSLWSNMSRTNALIKTYCEENEGVNYIDVATSLLNAEGSYPLTDIFLSDNLHLNSKGYDLWAGAIKPALMEAELKFETD